MVGTRVGVVWIVGLLRGFDMVGRLGVEWSEVTHILLAVLFSEATRVLHPCSRSTN